jgi:hypothetical protein
VAAQALDRDRPSCWTAVNVGRGPREDSAARADFRPRLSSSRPAAIRLLRRRRQRSSSASSWADPGARPATPAARTTRPAPQSPRRGLQSPHVRHQPTLRVAPSVQVQLSRTANLKVSAAHSPRTRDREPTRVSITLCDRRRTRRGAHRRRYAWHSRSIESPPILSRSG